MGNDNQYVLQYLPLFYEDLEQAISYIAGHLNNPQAAKKLIDDVEKAILERVPFAESYEQFRSVKPRPHPIYSIYVNNYVVYYVVIDHHIMEVQRLLYKGRDRRRMV